MHFGDYTFIFLLALVLFGPKKLPEIGRQLGKLLAEFRRASNEFKFQIQEELRNMEEEERRKKLAEQQAAVAAASPAPELPSETPASAVPEGSTTPTILPPSTGSTVSTGRPYATPVEAEPSAEDPTAADPKQYPHDPTDFSIPPENGASTEHVNEHLSDSATLAGVEPHHG